MLFASSDGSEVKEVRRKLFEAGIPCQVHRNPLAQGAFGVPSHPELWIKNEGDILKALRVLGPRRLGRMTVILPTS